MWTGRKRRPAEPQWQDQALLELSATFLEDPVDPTPGCDLLDLARYDYSVDSLAALEEHLQRMRTRELPAEQWNIFILRAGAWPTAPRGTDSHTMIPTWAHKGLTQAAFSWKRVQPTSGAAYCMEYHGQRARLTRWNVSATAMP
jgi:hypothetical protein